MTARRISGGYCWMRRVAVAIRLPWFGKRSSERRFLALSLTLMRSPDRQVTGVELTFAANFRTFGADAVVSRNLRFANIDANNR